MGNRDNFANAFIHSWRGMKRKPMAEGPSEVSYAPLSPKDAAMEFHWEHHWECDGVIGKARNTIATPEYGEFFTCRACGCYISVTEQGITEDKPYA